MTLLHDWAITPREAIAMQKELAPAIVRDDRCGEVTTVAGIDVAYGRRGGPARAAAVLFRIADLEPLEQAVVTLPVSFPYVPGLLTFREAPAAIAAIASLSVRPDLLLCDGQGIAHPRRLGFASHLGLFLDLPSVGVAKSRLIGSHEEPGPLPGDSAPLLHEGEVVGSVVRTRKNSRPLYISIGHRVSLATAVTFVLRCGKGFRLPEPCRAADRLSKAKG
jgi:deoxyribonuclease V